MPKKTPKQKRKRDAKPASKEPAIDLNRPPWDLAGIRAIIEAALEARGVSEKELTYRLGLTPWALRRAGRRRNEVANATVRRWKARNQRGVHRPQPTVYRFPLRLIERVIKQLGLEGLRADEFRLAAMLTNAPVALAEALEKVYAIRRRPR